MGSEEGLGSEGRDLGGRSLGDLRGGSHGGLKGERHWVLRGRNEAEVGYDTGNGGGKWVQTEEGRHVKGKLLQK